MPNGLTAVILAAGKSTRMRSDTPKVLHTLCGREIISYTLDLCLKLKIGHIIVILGAGKEKVCAYLKKHYAGKNIDIAVQSRLLGTADAILSARHKIKIKDTDLFVLYADQPLLGLGAAKALLSQYYKTNSAAALLTAKMDAPVGYGRIVRGKNGEILRIAEDKDLNEEEKGIREINAGSCIFKKEELFAVINKIRPKNKKREYYLTDAVRLLRARGRKISSLMAGDVSAAMGINSRSDLIKIEDKLRKKIIDRFLAQGVTIRSPATTFINCGVKIGRDTTINPFVYIDANVTIGKNCVIGPFAYLRGESVIKDNVVVGSFGELNRSSVGAGSRIKHFSYLGDAIIGKNVNIGAGTVTANFDGKNKNKTYVKDGAFIGSDTVLVAPVRIGRHASTGAGAVVTKNKNVPDKAVAFGVPAKIYPVRDRSPKATVHNAKTIR